jgi:hypothetical protein
MTHRAWPDPAGNGGTASVPDDAALIDWTARAPVQVGRLQLLLPAALVPRSGTAIDDPAAVFEGAGVTVVVDLSPFADRLDGHRGKPGYVEEPVRAAAGAGRRISFRDPRHGTTTAALHVSAPRPFTVVVTVPASVPDSVATAVLESLRLV